MAIFLTDIACYVMIVLGIWCASAVFFRVSKILNPDIMTVARRLVIALIGFRDC